MTPPPSPPLDLSPLSPLAPELAASIARIASDIALVIDRDGVIVNVAEGSVPLAPNAGQWVGRRWVDTVTSDTRGKIEQLLDEVRSAGVTRRREVNHPIPGGDDIPVAWAAIRLGDGGPVVAVGRDLRAVAAIQQKLVDAQQQLERDYWQGRQAEGRYRMLFQVASDAVLLLDAASFEVLDANDAAAALVGGAAPLVGAGLVGRLPEGARAAVHELLSAARSSGRAGEIRVRLVPGDTAHDLAATPFRAGDRQQLLLRARRGDLLDPAGTALATMAEFVESTPDAVAITDSAGRILMANRAFAALVGQRSEEPLRGLALPDLLGDGDGLWRALVARTRAQGIVPRAPITVRLGSGAALAVEATATLLTEGEQECLGFTLRPTEALVMPAIDPIQLIGRGLAELAEQLGRVPLAALLAEIHTLAEKQLIANALLRAGGGVTLAAQMLGISPHALERRLRRHRIDVPGDGSGVPPRVN